MDVSEAKQLAIVVVTVRIEGDELGVQAPGAQLHDAADAIDFDIEVTLTGPLLRALRIAADQLERAEVVARTDTHPVFRQSIASVVVAIGLIEKGTNVQRAALVHEGDIEP